MWRNKDRAKWKLRKAWGWGPGGNEITLRQSLGYVGSAVEKVVQEERDPVCREELCSKGHFVLKGSLNFNKIITL